jgi:hypothetical protein
VKEVMLVERSDLDSTIEHVSNRYGGLSAFNWPDMAQVAHQGY